MWVCVKEVAYGFLEIGVVVMNQSSRNKCSLAQHRHLCHHHHLCLLSCLPPLCHHHPVILPAPVHHAQHKSKHFISIISKSRRIAIFLGILLAYKTLWWSFQGLTMSSMHFPVEPQMQTGYWVQRDNGSAQDQVYFLEGRVPRKNWFTHSSKIWNACKEWRLCSVLGFRVWTGQRWSCCQSSVSKQTQ